MPRLLFPIAAAAASVLVWAAAPARADFSACGSAYAAKDPHQQIELYTICLKHGGLMATDVAGAFNQRGIAYERIGDNDNALQDFVSATQYDPRWPAFRANRAGAEAQKRQCAEALADIGLALKMAPHNKTYREMKDRICEACPLQSKPPN